MEIMDQYPQDLRASLKHQNSHTPTSPWEELALEAPLKYKVIIC